MKVFILIYNMFLFIIVCALKGIIAKKDKPDDDGNKDSDYYYPEDIILLGGLA